MIKRMIRLSDQNHMPRQAGESQGSWMIKAHPTENRMAGKLLQGGLRGPQTASIA